LVDLHVVNNGGSANKKVIKDDGN